MLGEEHSPSNVERCRLCEGNAARRFRATIFNELPVWYFKCTSCGSLQIERPHWLSRAYGGGNLSALDTGAAQRTLDNFVVASVVKIILRSNVVLDFGGGDGLLCRLLRDYGVECLVEDRYATATYAPGFANKLDEAPDLVLAFEVIEHFADPAKELPAVFERGARALLVSTQIFGDEDENWWYLARESGQHVFFYSYDALKFICNKWGYRVRFVGPYLLFTRQNSLSLREKILLKLVMRLKVFRFLKPALLMRRTPGVWKDHLQMKAAYQKSSTVQSTSRDQGPSAKSGE